LILLDTLFCGAAIALPWGCYVLGYRLGARDGYKEGWAKGLHDYEAVTKSLRLRESGNLARVQPISEGRGWP